MYEIDIAQVGSLLRERLLLTKPDVVLEHFKTEKAIPLSQNVRMQRKLFSTVEHYFESLNRIPSPSP